MPVPPLPLGEGWGEGCREGRGPGDRAALTQGERGLAGARGSAGGREFLLAATSQASSLLAFPETREGPASGEAIAPGRADRRQVLVAGVGYTCLTDLSVGPALVERLQARVWPAGVVVEDLSYGPIDVLFKLQASPPFGAAVFATAVSRGRAPGTLERVRWAAPSLPPDALQGCMAEAITGVISLDNLLHILAHFGALPPEVVVFEVEPLSDTWGLDFSPPVEAALAEAEDAVRREIERLLAAEHAA